MRGYAAKPGQPWSPQPGSHCVRLGASDGGLSEVPRSLTRSWCC